MSGPDPRIGTVLQDRYRIGDQLGDGAMGAVYRGEDMRLKRGVAVKFLHARVAAEAEGRRRFDVEARAMSRVAHPNLVTVSDFGVDGNTPYLVMELVSGQSLRAIINADRRLPPTRAIGIVRQVLAGLEHAHGHGIVHRDVKPENLLCATVEGHGEHVRVLDFGLARLREDASGMTMMSGLALGTPGYMAPEVWMCLAVDARTDIYSVGILLYELIVGRKPFVAEAPVDMMRAHRSSPPPPLHEMAPDVQVSSELEWVIQCALAKKPDERFSTASAFLGALSNVPEVTGRPSAPRQAAAPTPTASAPAANPAPPPAPHAPHAPATPMTPAASGSDIPQPPRRRTGLIVACIVGALALVAVIGVAAESCGKDDAKVGTPQAPR